MNQKNERESVLYVTDLDGTLLNSQSRISEYSLNTINRLLEQGMKFTYATARSLVSASSVTEGLHISTPVIVYNGAYIMCADTGKILYSQTFQEEERRKVREVLKKWNISPFIYSFVNGEERVLYRPDFLNEGKERYLTVRRGDRRFRTVEGEEALFQGEMFYFTCIGEKEELEPVYQEFQKDSRFRCTLQQELYRPEYWCEIMPAKATKAQAILALKSMWNCEKIISFGDAVNDLPMFDISDACYAVANAVKSVQERATAVILENDKDGVARWLEEHALAE